MEKLIEECGGLLGEHPEWSCEGWLEEITNKETRLEC